MRIYGYRLARLGVRIALHLYYGKIVVRGLEHVPKDKAVLFLPNHQNALLDVLLIAIDCNRAPYFLTRSDVFKGGVLKAIFEFCRMIPIYRIRDGRDSLKNNQAVFDSCAELFQQRNAILMFPEANHNLKRRVRPLSKGFTRILFNALDAEEDLDIHIVPVGLNYRDAISFPDKVAVSFGAPISARPLYDPNDINASVAILKNQVSERLKTLTTHIDDDTNYEEISKALERGQPDYLQPQRVNEMLANSQTNSDPLKKKEKRNVLTKLLEVLFLLLNFPMALLWKKGIKPKVWEPEFMGTLRFAFGLVVYPFYYLILFILLAIAFTAPIAFFVLGALVLFNWMYVRIQ